MGLFKKDYYSDAARMISELKTAGFSNNLWQQLWRYDQKRRALTDFEEEDLKLIRDIRELYAEHKDVPELSAKILSLAACLKAEIERLRNLHDANRLNYEKSRIRQLVAEIDMIFKAEVRRESEFVKMLRQGILAKNHKSIFILGHATWLKNAPGILMQGKRMSGVAITGTALTTTSFPLANKPDELLVQLYQWGYNFLQAEAIILFAFNTKYFPQNAARIDVTFNYWSNGAIPPQFILGYVDLTAKRLVLNRKFDAEHQNRYIPPPMSGGIRSGMSGPPIPPQPKIASLKGPSKIKGGDIW